LLGVSSKLVILKIEGTVISEYKGDIKFIKDEQVIDIFELYSSDTIIGYC